jgi:uncharacterized protein with FMN-binding domain
MKRAMLIASGTITGLGAVLAITPPQLNATTGEIALPTDIGATTSTQTPAATPTAKATKKGTAKPTATTAAATPTPVPTQAASSGVKDGKFVGSAVNVSYGIVQVQVTIANGKITDAQAIQAPSGRNDRWTQMAVPILRANTLKAQSNKITGASGASYTSYGWYTSLTSALKKAGMI